MGFFAVAFGFGLAFGVNIAWFGWISAHLNPGMFFFLAIQGEVSWPVWAVGTVADFLGAFAGACLVWLFFLPHFDASLPLPPDDNDLATLLYGPSGLDENAGRLASAFGDQSRPSPPEDGKERGEPGGDHETPGFSPRRLELRRLIGRGGVYDDDQREALLEKMEVQYGRRMRYKVRPLSGAAGSTGNSILSNHRSEFVHDVIGPHGQLRRANSIQVATLHRGKDDDDAPGAGDPASDGSATGHKRRHSAQIAILLHEHDVDDSLRPFRHSEEGGNGKSNEPGKDASTAEIPRTDATEPDTATTKTEKRLGFPEGGTAPAPPAPDGGSEKGPGDTVSPASLELTPYQQRELAKRREAFEAALTADSAAKLSIFATRPAVYNLRFNFMQEALASAVLFFGAAMFDLATESQQEQSGGAGVITAGNNPLLDALWVSLLITLLILGLGGVTGLAVNPARDIGPRMAHWVLPFPNKGPSEWNYGLRVPLLAPYVGACLGAGLYQAMIGLYGSDNQDEL